MELTNHDTFLGGVCFLCGYDNVAACFLPHHCRSKSLKVVVELLTRLYYSAALLYYLFTFAERKKTASNRQSDWPFLDASSETATLIILSKITCATIKISPHW